MSSVHLRRLQIGSFARWTGTAFLNDPFPRGRYVHAAQGDGEACGSGLETSAEVAFRFGLLRQKTIGWPRLEDAEHLMVAASARPLTDALRIAFVELVGWLADDHGFSRPDAYQLVSQVAVDRVANVVDPLYTVVAKFPKRHLPRGAAASPPRSPARDPSHDAPPP